ncbi:MAG: chemotaxis protein CheX [Treponema sp.]|jgi:CheY-specific phosphatase CheX|nr:chemotaxis protein CheX [Treponema sp.]
MGQSSIGSLIQPFAEVCIYVFKELVSTKIVVNRPYVPDKNIPYSWDISALIRFTGQVQGVLGISMKRALAQKLTGLLLMESWHTTLDKDVMDILCEIANIIAGRAKQRLENTCKLQIALPTIILGGDISPLCPSRMVCIPFTIFEHEFFVLSLAIECD